ASCHGTNAAGRDGAGPPLIHIIYETGHHGDPAFYQAVRVGVRAHHWRFGSMPAIEGVSKSDVRDIVTYIRELQRANDIF
ncbi:MAG: cytochrome c, partial [Pseudomonadota bacterium]